MKKASELKILLLQIRDDEQTMQEELYEFVQFSGLHEEQFTVLNTFITDDFDVSAIEGHDALFIGGSSDATVLKPEEFAFVTDCRLLIRYCYDHTIPVFASCFGFQLLVQEFAGTVVLDPDNMEMGTYPIELTEAAKADLLFHDMPKPFWGVSGHKERAETLPSIAINLAYSSICPYHAIKLEDKPIYAFQFHPEVDSKDLRARVERYKRLYLDNDQQVQEIIDNIHPDTAAANSLVRRFVERVLCA